MLTAFILPLSLLLTTGATSEPSAPVTLAPTLETILLLQASTSGIHAAQKTEVNLAPSRFRAHQHPIHCHSTGHPAAPPHRTVIDRLQFRLANRCTSKPSPSEISSMVS